MKRMAFWQGAAVILGLVLALAIAGNSAWGAEYRSYAELAADLADLATQYPDIARLYDIGDSVEHRNIWALKISNNPDMDEAEAEVLFVGGHHAREWISVEVPYYLGKYLLDNYASNSGIKDLVDQGEIWIVPLVNPDGLEYSRTTDRYWRKNRRNNGDGTYGVDLNRNYSYMWGGAGASPDTDDETYRGPAAFSEPETQAIRDLVASHDFQGLVSYHSYGQLILYPWGYTNTPSGDQAQLAGLGNQMSEFIAGAYGTQYTVQQSAELYPASGDLTDWSYGVYQIPSFTIEMRPENWWDGGFELPATEIIPTFLENLSAALYLTSWTQGQAGSSITGSSSGIFVNPYGPSGMQVSGVGTDFFSWGEPSPASSYLWFDGAFFSAATGQDFKLGDLYYYNGTITADTEADSVDLQVTLTFTNPPGVSQNFDFNFVLVNTLNTEDPWESADYVFLPTGFADRIFNVGDKQYTLQLLGFGTMDGGTFVLDDEFHVLEGDETAAELWGRVTEVNLVTITPENLKGHITASGNFAWDYSYDLSVQNGKVYLDVDIQLTGNDPGTALRDQWESGIEGIWSNRYRIAAGDYEYPIMVDVEWVTTNADYTVTVHQGSGRSNMTNWYTNNPGGWSNDYQDEIAAHEFGHMLGLYDEYVGGALDPTTQFVSSNTLMSDLGPLQESYFESILAWMENRSGRDLSLVTAPSPPYPMDDPLPDFSDPLPVTYLSYFTLRSGEFYVAVMVAGEDFGVYLGFEALHPSNSFFGFYQTTDKSDDARNSMFYFAFGDGTRYAGVQHTEETSGYCVGINLDAPQEQFLGIYQWQAQNQTWNFSYQYSSPGYRGLALWTQDYPTFVGYAADNPGQYFWMVSMFSGGEAPVYSYWILWHGVTLMEENS